MNTPKNTNGVCAAFREEARKHPTPVVRVLLESIQKGEFNHVLDPVGRVHATSGICAVLLERNEIIGGCNPISNSVQMEVFGQPPTIKTFNYESFR